jgi:hypothetical protein
MSLTYLSSPVEVTPGSTGWQDVDNANVPDTATGVILHIVNKHASSWYNCGWRKNGSTDNRADQLKPDMHIWTFVGCDGSGIFEVNVGNTTNMDVWLVGYVESDAAFLTNGTDYLPGSDDTWTDADITTDTGGDTAVAAFFEITQSGDTDVGYRKNGSTDARLPWNYQRHHAAVIGVDSGEVAELYKGSTSVTGMYLLGYFKDSASVTFNTNATDYSLSTTDAWTDLTALPANAIGGFFEVNAVSSAVDAGLRKNGTGEDIYRLLGNRKSAAIIECDGSQLIEGKIDTANIDFWLSGWATSSGTLYYKTITGALTFTGVTAKKLKRTLTGALTPSGLLAKKTKRTLTGVFTPTGIVNKKSFKELAGAVTFSGVATGVKVITKTVSGALTFVGNLAAVKLIKKTITGGLTFAGSAAGEKLVDIPLPYGWGSGAKYGFGFQYGYGWLGFEKDIATDYLVGKQFDDTWTNSEGLIQSYMPEYVLPGYANTIKRCMIWDSALAAISFTLDGYTPKALKIFTQLDSIQEGDGSFTSEVDADTGDKLSSYHAAVAALVAYALGIFEQKTGNSTYQTMMTDACDWLETLMDATHDGVAAEASASNFPTVVNVLAYYAFRECYRITSTSKYDTDADDVKAFILGYLWNGTDNYFYQDVDDDTKNLLAQVFGAMFLKSINDTGKVSLLSNIFGEFLNKDAIRDISGLDCFEGTGSTLNITEPQLSYVEGTILAALMSHKIGAYGNRETFINEMRKVQSIDLSHYGSGLEYGAGLRYGYNTGYDGGLLHSSKDRYDFYEYYGAGATAMMVIYACCIIKDDLNGLIFNDDD